MTTVRTHILFLFLLVHTCLAGESAVLRGNITDRHGEVLVRTGTPSHLRFIPSEANNSPEGAKAAIAELNDAVGHDMGFSAESLKMFVQRGGGKPYGSGMIPSPADLAALRAAKLTNWDLAPWPRREYPQKALAGNLLGLVSTQLGEKISVEGRGGLEKCFDADLNQGWIVVTTLDLALQQHAQKLFADLDRPGAIVVLEAGSGEVRAMVSWPTFDPNQFVPAIPIKEYEALGGNPKQPLSDRTMANTLSPGAAIRPFSSLSLVQAGAIDPGKAMRCEPVYRIGNVPFKNWNAETETLDLAGAIRRSNHVYLFQAAAQVDGIKFYDALSAFGFGRQTGIEPPDIAGTLGGGADAHQPSVLANLSVGQGYLEATPLQLARALAAIVNGGALMQPRVALRVLEPDGKVQRELAPKKERDLALPEGARKEVLRGMREAVAAADGTATAAALPTWTVAGVTGSAYYHRKVEEEPVKMMRGTFVGFAPFENPRYVVVVALEECTGGKDAAAVAAGIFRFLHERPE